jgi:hypothetical protein
MHTCIQALCGTKIYVHIQSIVNINSFPKIYQKQQLHKEKQNKKRFLELKKRNKIEADHYLF